MKATFYFLLCFFAFDAFGQSLTQEQQSVLRAKVLNKLKNDKAISKKQINDSIFLMKYPLLERVLPSHHFYTTFVSTIYYEYSPVEIAIAENDQTKKIIITKSPVFSAITPEFMQVFAGIELEGDSLKSVLAQEIGDLLAQITYQGKAKALENKNENTYSIELWHSDLSWCFVDFVYEEKKLNNIVISPGVKRSQTLPSQYKRI